MVIAAFEPLPGSTSIAFQRLNDQAGRWGWPAELALSLIVNLPLCWLHTRQVERQLARRSEQVWNVWSARGFDLHLAKRLCGSIQETAGWSKPWFVPEDSLDLVLDLAFDVLGLVEFIQACERVFGVRLEPETLQDCQNLGDVAHVLAGLQDGSRPDADRMVPIP